MSIGDDEPMLPVVFKVAADFAANFAAAATENVSARARMARGVSAKALSCTAASSKDSEKELSPKSKSLSYSASSSKALMTS